MSADVLPLVSSVLVSTEASGKVEGAVWSQAGVYPLRQVEDLGRREGLPLALLPLQPTLAAAGWVLLPAPVEGGGGDLYQSENKAWVWRRRSAAGVLSRAVSLSTPYLLRPSFLDRSRPERSCRQQMRKDRDMARMTMPLTTDANTATLRPRSSGLGIADEGKKRLCVNVSCNRSQGNYYYIMIYIITHTLTVNGLYLYRAFLVLMTTLYNTDLPSTHSHPHSYSASMGSTVLWGAIRGLSILPKDTSMGKTGIEPPTFMLEDDRSTPQPQPHNIPLSFSFLAACLCLCQMIWRHISNTYKWCFQHLL